MRINDFIVGRNELWDAKTAKARVLLQEEDPYNRYTSISGELITDWYNTFICKLDESFRTGQALSMGCKEKNVYDKYINTSIFLSTDLQDTATKNLDEYLATILVDDLDPEIIPAQ